MQLEEFLQEARAKGYADPVEVHQPMGYNMAGHSHPFDAFALITQGQIDIGVAGVTISYRTGDVFRLAAGTHHTESAVEQGVTYLAARRTRPFKVLGIQQIAIGGPDKQRLQQLWVEMLGLQLTGTFRSERENVDEDICALGSGPFKVEVDLMQPLDPDKKPAVHTTPLNHVGLWIDDLPAAVDWLTARGVRFAPGGIRKGAAGFDICFLHPKANDEFPIAGEGVLVELVQAPPEVVKAFAALAESPVPT
jgi:lactoylglutathione lyase